MTLRQWHESIRRKATVAPKRRAVATKRKPQRFTFVLPSFGMPQTKVFGPQLRRFTETAMTRSEARAQLKKRLGLRRLPIGASVREERKAA